jgi:hypothetical protein
MSQKQLLSCKIEGWPQYQEHFCTEVYADTSKDRASAQICSSVILPAKALTSFLAKHFLSGAK